MTLTNDSYFFSSSLAEQAIIHEQGMTTQSLRNDDHVKAILFGFAGGHELKAHSAPVPVTLFFLKGDGELSVGQETVRVSAGSLACIAPTVIHAVRAKTPLVMVLVMAKGGTAL